MGRPVTILETILTLTLLVVVPWVVWSAIDLIALRRDVQAWDADLELESDLRRSLNRRHVELTARVDTLEDSRSRTADLDVPVLHQPIPPNFHRNR